MSTALSPFFGGICQQNCGSLRIVVWKCDVLGNFLFVALKFNLTSFCKLEFHFLPADLSQQVA